MTRKDQTNPRRRKGRAALLAALLMGVMLAVPVQPVRATGSSETGGQVEQEAINFDAKGSLTVTTSMLANGDEQMADDLEKEAEIVVDLYRVATAEPLNGFDTYNLKATADFKDIAAEVSDAHPTGETWAATAQKALKIVLDNKLSPTMADCAFNTKIDKLELGMYLIVPRGKTLTEPAQYSVTGEDGTIRTIGNSKRYQYSFLPVLVAVPARGVTADGEVPAIINEQDIEISNETSNVDMAWQYDLTVALKAEWKPLLTSMEIVKDLSAYETGKKDIGGKSDPATFVFKVEGKLNDEHLDSKTITYSNVFTVVLNKAREADPIRIDNLPIGMEMTVTEVYPGANYEAVVADGVKLDEEGHAYRTKVLEVPMDPEKPEVVPEDNILLFKNDYNETFHGGGSVTNSYSKNADGHITGDPEQQYDDGRAVENDEEK